MKTERKGSDNGSRRDKDVDDDEEEEDRSIEGQSARREDGHMKRPSQGSYSGASVEQKRAEPKQQSHSSYDSTPLKRQDKKERGKGSFTVYRDSAVFSDEAQSPTGKLS